MPLSLGLFCRPVSLMDKTMDSGSIDVGSIPTRGTSFEYRLIGACALLLCGGLLMNVHCGMDIVELDRIDQAILKHGDSFLNKVFTKVEREYCESKGKAALQSFAARFCAKEAVSKALGTGIAKGVTFQDIEIINDDAGKPVAVLHGEAKRLFEKMGGKAIDVSLTHSRHYAAAQAVILL